METCQMADLVIRPSTLLAHKPWVLQLRYHHGGAETECVTIARLSEQKARDVVAAGAAGWLCGEPNKDTPPGSCPTTPQNAAGKLAERPASGSSDDDARFENSYCCPECGHEWSDHWSATSEDDCPSRLPSFLDDTEHLYDDSLRCQHFSKLFDEGHKQVL
jgi:hypothetical protein